MAGHAIGIADLERIIIRRVIDRFDEVFIILDKMDKIGLDGVARELTEAGFGRESADRYTDLFKDLEENGYSLSWLAGRLEGYIEPGVGSSVGPGTIIVGFYGDPKLRSIHNR